MNLLQPASLLRQRRGNGDQFIGIQHHKCPNDEYEYSGANLGTLPSNAFVASYIVLLVVGTLCTWIPPSATTSIDGVSIPEEAMCLRASRHADYASAELNIGSPGRRIQVLIRFDKVVSSTDQALRVFESKILESKSITCSGVNSNCTDAVMTTDVHQSTGFQRMVSGFGYTAESIEASIAKSYLRMEGELRLVRGHKYWLTSSHLCFQNTEEVIDSTISSSENLVLGSVVDGITTVQDSELAKAKILKSSFARQATVDFLCELNGIHFLPVLSNVDQIYLSISDYSFYSAEPDSIRLRRNMVEVGQVCASKLPKEKYGSDYELYILDCGAAGTCASNPSIPYRRISTLDMHMHIDTNGKFVARFQADNVLNTLSGLSDSAEAITLAVAKLILIIVAASLVWVRADRATSRTEWLIKHCLKSVNCEATPKKDQNARSIAEDALMGLFCILARFSIAFWRYEQLSKDSQGRSCILEIAASGLSFIHWTARYFIISPSIFDMMSGVQDANGPLTRLGGSSAILDVTGSVLLAFSEPPTLVSTLSRFEPTARILISMLIVMVAIPRCLFSISCCTLLYESGRSGKTNTSEVYMNILLLSSFFWLFQLITIATTLNDLIVTPFSISITRSTIGETFWIRLCLFLGALNVGIPRLLSSIFKLKRMMLSS